MRVLLGRINGPHGIQGDVVVHSYTEVPEAIADYGDLTDAAGGRPLRLKVKRATPKGIIASVAGIGDRTTAEALKGAELWVERRQLPEPEPGEFYYEDLLGLQAVDLEGGQFGEVAGVVNYGAGDLLEIRLTGSRKTELIPFGEAYVPEIDIAGGRVVVAWPLQFEIADKAEDASVEEP